MSINLCLKQNPTFTDADTINNWCQPLSLLGITYFCHVQLDKQNRMRFISNYPEFQKHFLKQGLHQYDVHMNPHFRESQIIMWDLFEPKGKSIKMHSDFVAFGRDHTFTIIEPNDEGCDYFHFATNAGQFHMNQQYFNHQDILKQFISYYLDKLSRSPAIQKTFSVGLPLKSDLGNYSLAEVSNQENLNAFYKMTAHQRHYIQGCLNYLTQAEINSMFWIAQGKSMNETAILLGITIRTVKAHIKNAKEKLKCDNLFQLGMYFKDKYSSLIKTEWKPKLSTGI